MQNVVDSTSAVRTLQPTQPVATALADNNSQSTASSPKSTKASVEGSTSNASGSTVLNAVAHELTPPSSIASSQEQPDVGQPLVGHVRLKENEATPTVTGKKRTANGQVKETGSVVVETVDSAVAETKHARVTSTSLPASSGGLIELSQSLKTRLTYAMVKVQNGWQKHSIEEVESLASHSPRSTLSTFTPRDPQSAFSPRSSLNSQLLVNSNVSGHSTASRDQQSSLVHMTAPIPPPGIADSPTRRSLAPPATIVSGQRRRPTPNINLQINSTLRSPSKPKRPTTAQRTPSQNAAMEADAVETLLFMSTSPNNSGHFPSHLSAYSPTSQAFSTQTSPLKSQFDIHEKRLSTGSAYSPRVSNHRRYEDKAALIDRLLHDLDDDESEELDRAVKIMEQHRATKLSA